MTDEIPSLFDMETADTSTPGAPLPVRPEQVAKLRREFERAGIMGQEERKEIVESVTGRPVASLHDLQDVEGQRILVLVKGINPRKPDRTGTAWDDREEETWIDKL